MRPVWLSWSLILRIQTAFWCSHLDSEPCGSWRSRPFSRSQASTQAEQPSAHLAVSINRPQRTESVTGSLRGAAETLCRKTPGATSAAALSPAAVPMKPRRPASTVAAGVSSDVEAMRVSFSFIVHRPPCEGVLATRPTTPAARCAASASAPGRLGTEA